MPWFRGSPGPSGRPAETTRESGWRWPSNTTARVSPRASEVDRAGGEAGSLDQRNHRWQQRGLGFVADPSPIAAGKCHGIEIDAQGAVWGVIGFQGVAATWDADGLGVNVGHGDDPNLAHRLEGGMRRLIDALAQELPREHMHFDHALVRLQDAGAILAGYIDLRLCPAWRLYWH